MTPQQRYYRKNRDRLLKESRERYHQNIEEEHKRSYAYKEANREAIKSKRNQRSKQKRKDDPSFKIKSNVSRRIREILKRNNSSKSGKTISNYLGYSMKELKGHLEQHFETWMNWSNYGVYKKSQWNDNDSTTWTWQIDHIIPQSKLQYSSMEDENFKKCWSLENLRPLSAKENFNRGIELLKGRNL